MFICLKIVLFYLNFMSKFIFFGGGIIIQNQCRLIKFSGALNSNSPTDKSNLTLLCAITKPFVVLRTQKRLIDKKHTAVCQLFKKSYIEEGLLPKSPKGGV